MGMKQSPESSRDASSPRPSLKDPYLWGGVAFVVGIVALAAAPIILFLGNVTGAEASAVLGAVLLVAGFAIARYGRRPARGVMRTGGGTR